MKLETHIRQSALQFRDRPKGTLLSSIDPIPGYWVYAINVIENDAFENSQSKVFAPFKTYVPPISFTQGIRK